MTWVLQSFDVPGLMKVDLHGSAVALSGTAANGSPSAIIILPKAQSDAHAAALMLRRAARRLEEIGKELS